MTHRPEPRWGRCTGDLPRLLVAVAARTALWTVLLLAAWSVLPATLGWQVTTVVSGSMAPAIRVGDVVAAMPVAADRVTEGRVLLVDDPDRPDRLRLHRVARVHADGTVVLRGDANAEPDRTPVGPAAVRGLGVLRFPWIGLPGVWVRTHDWLAVGIAAAATAVVVLLARVDRDALGGQPCRRCGAPRWSVSTAPPGGRTPTVAPVAVPAVVVVAALVAGVGASAGFTAPTSSGSSMRSATGFPCFSRIEDEPRLAWDFADKTQTLVRDTTGGHRDAVPTEGFRNGTGDCGDDLHGTITGAPGRVQEQTTTTSPGSFTSELWFRTDLAQGRVIGFGDSRTGASSTYDRMVYVGASGAVVFGVYDGSWPRTVTSTVSVADGSWHHVVGVFEPGRMELWLDGTLAGARADVTAAKTYQGSWRIGSDTVKDNWPDQPTSTVFIGDVDTVRVHDRALDEDAVRRHFAAGR